ncbi:MAG: hypothetical protein ACTSPX_03155 [Candidatus Thorarchaeota archaeon]
MRKVKECCWICKHLDYGFECNDEEVTYKCFFYCELKDEEIYVEDCEDIFSTVCDEFELNEKLREVDAE